jgi:hypothetical protein
MATKSFQQQLKDWQVLHDNLAPRLTDLPQFTADHTALGQVLTQAQDLENKQDAARATLRDVNQQRQQMTKQGTDLRNRLALGLRYAFGTTSEKLIEFGIDPRPRTLQRTRLSEAEKAARAAARATKKAEALATDAPPPAPNPKPST